MNTTQTTTQQNCIYHLRSGMMLALCVALFSSGCTTVETSRIVLEEPMTADTEARVLKETGISGALIGGLVGGLAVGATAAGITALRGGNSQQIATAGVGGFVGGAAAGGVAGYYKGKEQGQKIVAKAMTRDQVRQILEGARRYNRRLANVNEALRERVRQVRKSRDPRVQRQEYSQLIRVAKKEAQDSAKRINEREKALVQAKWSSDDKPIYRERLTTLKEEHRDLSSLITKMEKAQQNVSL